MTSLLKGGRGREWRGGEKKERVRIKSSGWEKLRIRKHRIRDVKVIITKTKIWQEGQKIEKGTLEQERTEKENASYVSAIPWLIFERGH